MRFYAKRVGGLVHWRIGRLGGSVYLARRRPAEAMPDGVTIRARRIAARLAR